MEKDVLYTTMIMTFTVGVDLGFVLGCFLLGCMREMGH